ncbi:3-oxoacyl-[acyl-carrier-protein] reductase FabG [Clostridium bornimense]|uniref:3-oxoacyl-[acyl-carrier-protein] reductase FabG n=1 Tax=Clostridium bornimense TaxID=1216932 RepID=W6RUK5_9CLOT|nr:SDR family oxidoreductase [Clostridium bornimense]CDM68341.1 3-oxoacyl-[acyl-carrier-protein] reductase FabG [Clostridium bornimense]
MKLDGKVALITGASKGIGKEISKEFIKNGATVIINYKNDTEYGDITFNELQQYGIVERFIGDVSNEEFVVSMIDSIISKYGKIDVLVNNAGISSFNMLVDTTISDFNNIMDINFKSVYLLSREVLRSMMYAKGVILNISSMWGEHGSSCETIYSASKGAINAFTKALSKEVSSMGVRVNAIAPGAIDTDMNKHFTEEEKKDIEEMCSLGRLGTAKEIAKVALFLCSDDSSFITGEIINVTGGKI